MQSLSLHPAECEELFLSQGLGSILDCATEDAASTLVTELMQFSNQDAVVVCWSCGEVYVASLPACSSCGEVPL
jgi:hypothetical protein